MFKVLFMSAMKWTVGFFKGIVALVIILFLSASSALASHVEDPVAERQEIMKQLGVAMKHLTPVFAKKAVWNEARLIESTNAIKDNIHPELAQLFQFHVTPTEHSRSKMNIDSSWEDFELRLTELSQLADALLIQIPQGHPVAQETFRAMVKNCSGCHKRYRNKINDR